MEKTIPLRITGKLTKMLEKFSEELYGEISGLKHNQLTVGYKLLYL
jgi:hypothetical protein